ncbi:MAG: translation initiation factor IF-2 [Chloroflexi bacterium]|nr:translation initiation factor IF-2 [Chloroflexota bacterium]
MEERLNQGTGVTIPQLVTVRQLADLLRVSPIEIIKALISDGIMANINQTIDYETAAIVATEMGFEPQPEAPPPTETRPETAPTPTEPARKAIYAGEAEENMLPRPPVVTVMGHVDHGKTTLLDAIRQTNVAAGERGGITQHIGAYQVEKQGRKITFLDTPGHEAFTAMRARGAQVTDVAVLVVAADDGVMPQTKEAVDHARAAQVPIIVALNKIDKPEANPGKVKGQLKEIGLVIEELGGQVVSVPVSAKKGEGIDQLLEMILLSADLLELKANPQREAMGSVVEGRLDKTKGPLATLLVQNGTLSTGDYLVVGAQYGRVRAMFNDLGKRVKTAPPSTPVVVLGLPVVPAAGESFRVVADERTARGISEESARQKETTTRPATPLTLDELYSQMQAGKVKELRVVLKVDVQGSLEPLRNSLEKLGDENLRVRIIHQATGNVTESDVNLAIASQAVVIGFNVQADTTVRSLAEKDAVEIRLYDVIYRLVEDIEKALQGMLEPVYEEAVIGRAEIRKIFEVKRGKVAGAMVTSGVVKRNAPVRVKRGEEIIYQGQITSLKRFAENVQEVAAGFDCGLALGAFQDFREGDVVEVLEKQRVS